jgi:amidase
MRMGLTPAPRSTAAEIAGAVRAGAVSPVEVVRACLERIAAQDPQIGAFQRVRGEAALREAEALALHPRLGELPLAGVPIAIKDNIPVAGEPMRVGSAATSDAPSSTDHEVVRRLREAGAVVVGLTRVPELCIWPFTDGALGTARNPWNREHTAGGSSGGSAAAVAAGLVPIAHGNDGLGSVRIPASACGLIGWKPGDGTVPADIGNGSWFGMSSNGVLATTAADAALMAAVLAGQPAVARLSEPAALRIGMTTASPVPGARTSREAEGAVHAVAEALRSFGHRVDTIGLKAPTGVALQVFAHWFAGTSLDVETLPHPEHLLPRTQRHAALGRWVRRLGWLQRDARARWRAQLLSMFGEHDLLLTPTTATTAIAAEGWAQQGWGVNVRASLAFAPFTGAANFAGLPAISVPAGLHDGLPLGAHFVGRPGSEGVLFGIAAQVERARPWPRHAP